MIPDTVRVSVLVMYSDAHILVLSARFVLFQATSAAAAAGAAAAV
jgi:hypothetical protein